jgi:hypothetical protein
VFSFEHDLFGLVGRDAQTGIGFPDHALAAAEFASMKIDGKCHCGRVSYEADIDPECVSICHCTDCQTLTGSPYRVTVLYKRQQIALTGSEPAAYAKAGDNGRTRVQYFCSTCGSPLFSGGCCAAAPWAGQVAALPGRPTE